MGLRVAADRWAGKIDVYDRAGRCEHADRAKTPRILGNGGIGQLQHRVVGRTMGDTECAVDRSLRLPGRTVIIDGEIASIHRHLCADGVDLVLDAVVFHAVFKNVTSVWNLL